MDYVLVSDAFRFYVAIVALWLAMVLLRLTFVRLKAAGLRRLWTHQQSPHPLSTLGLATMMLLAVGRRFDNLGKPGDVFLWGVVLAVTLVLAGVLINVRFDLRPPWGRHEGR